MTTTAAPAFRYIGVTDECTECERCGRSQLRNTVVLAVLDVDGNVDGQAFYGSDCAARTLGTGETSAAVLRSARYATVATLRAAYAAHERAALHATFARFNEFGGLEWIRPQILASARAGVDTAVERVAAIRALADSITDAAAIGYPTMIDVRKALRRGGWL